MNFNWEIDNDTEISSLPSSEFWDVQQGSWGSLQPISTISRGRIWTSTVTRCKSGKANETLHDFRRGT